MSRRTSTAREEVDVVVVGARVAGSSTAIELARRGRRVIAIDGATFPSDTLSTHVIFPSCVAEIKALGALDRLLATGSPKEPHALMNHGGHDSHWTYTPVDGIDYGMCPRRTTLDTVLVETAREVGVDVREATKVTGLVWDRGRVAGVRWQDRDGRTGEIACRLVVGADGRRSTVAELVGEKEPYRRDENGRGLVFMYVDDPLPADSPERRTLYQWRIGDTLGMYFPTCDDGGLVLFMPPKEQVADYRQDLETWNRALAANLRLKERIGGGAPRTKLRKAADPFSYFRRSSGPGWALVGDAGHFKDPVIAQGIRDAIYYGRRLGMAAAETLDDRNWLDRRMYEWELDRDRECLPAYHFGLRLSGTHAVSPIEIELFKDLEASHALSRELADTFGRTQSCERLLSYPRLIEWTTKAWLRRSNDKATIRWEVARELGVKLDLYRDLYQITRRRRVKGSPSTWDPWGGTSAPAAAKPTWASEAATYARPSEPQTSELVEVA